MRHPVATSEQHEHERDALALTQHPTVRRAFDEVRSHWLAAARPGEDMARCFEAAFEEVMFSAAVWSLNEDVQRPRVVTITRLAHPIGELQIPGSRWGIDNPDTVYRVIPISGEERYRITGRVAEPRMSENYFTLWDEQFNTVDVLNGAELVLDDDGRFVITVDSEPGGERPNHVRSAPAAHELYIRDVIQDWAVETPNELSVERLEGPPLREPRSLDEQAARTADFMLRYADSTRRWNQQAYDKPANELEFTIDRETDGALRNQVYILGHFALEPDEALVIDVQLGGAGYFVAPITNCWGTTNDIVSRTSCLNLAQTARNEDGSCTYVLSRADPGVHNWLDPCDMGEGILTLRWAEFPGGRPTPEVGATSRVVPLAGVRDAVSPGTTFVTAQERAAQCAARKQAYLRRLPEV
jgi:hypothetical protein